MEQTAPILDLRYLNEVTSGDKKFIADILSDYLREMDSYLSELDTSLKERSLGTALRAAHTIKGASANVGATRVRDLASKIESQAQKGSFEGGVALVKLLQSEIHRVKEIIGRQSVDELLREL